MIFAACVTCARSCCDLQRARYEERSHESSDRDGVLRETGRLDEVSEQIEVSWRVRKDRALLPHDGMFRVEGSRVLRLFSVDQSPSSRKSHQTNDAVRCCTRSRRQRC